VGTGLDKLYADLRKRGTCRGLFVTRIMG